ncbi:MAG: hypothetical protein E7233_06440 [Lachnospiraceae bacterium]|nr:hypothetical protein [Lachnospiraceae bacterium]
MEKRRLVFYGDSNTYGYDPRDFSGWRYPEKSIWVSLVAEALKDVFDVENEGVNGRRIPTGRFYSYDTGLIGSLSENDIFAIMLGTNDILMNIEPDADRAIKAMDEFIGFIKEQEHHPRILIIAPPCIGQENDADLIFMRFYRECVKMNDGFRKIAETRGCTFADASGWGIEMSFDRCHFSEEGHRIFAKHMISFLKGEKNGLGLHY